MPKNEGRLKLIYVCNNLLIGLGEKIILYISNLTLHSLNVKINTETS